VAFTSERCEHELDLAALAVHGHLDVRHEAVGHADGLLKALFAPVRGLSPIHAGLQCRGRPPTIGITVHRLIRR
jgi:hypothetical protein